MSFGTRKYGKSFCYLRPVSSSSQQEQTDESQWKRQILRHPASRKRYEGAYGWNYKSSIRESTSTLKCLTVGGRGLIVGWFGSLFWNLCKSIKMGRSSFLNQSLIKNKYNKKKWEARFSKKGIFQGEISSKSITFNHRFFRYISVVYLSLNLARSPCTPWHCLQVDAIHLPELFQPLSWCK